VDLALGFGVGGDVGEDVVAYGQEGQDGSDEQQGRAHKGGLLEAVGELGGVAEGVAGEAGQGWDGRDGQKASGSGDRVVDAARDACVAYVR
jgi:hypothetical protein